MGKRNAFYTEHVQEAPAGWRLRTVTHPSGHEVRLAFPPGGRKKGSGRLIEILHPHGENPESCNGPLRSANPSEILIMAMGNPKTKKGKKNPKLVTEAQAEAMQEKAITALDNFDSDDPNDIHGMSVAEYAEHKGLTITNPGKGKSRKAKQPKAKKAKGKKNPRKNQDAGGLEQGKELYRGFHGKEPEEIRDLAIKTEVQKTYVYGGNLAAVRFLQDDGYEWKVKFHKDGVKLAADPKGTQLYCIGGNQNLLPILEERGLDTSKELISIGRWYCVYYDAAKSLTNFQMTEWEHYFGCGEEITKLLKESEAKGWSNEEFQARVEKVMAATPPLERDLPEALYDRRNQRILFAGGSYYVDWPGIVG